MHTCPRRVEGGPLSAGVDQDDYLPGKGLGKQARGCSYCGSMSGGDFLAAVRDGVQVGPTDKSYKAYIGDYDGKVYFQHLDPAQQEEFIALLNAREVNIGAPGHFYVTPYFAIVATPTS